MKYTSLSEALEHIHNSNEDLTPSEAAVVHDLLHDVPAADNIRRRCEKVLQEYCHDRWLQLAPLHDVMIIAGMLYKYGQLDGGQLAVVVRRLLGAESQVGGPYVDSYGKVGLEVNVAVLYFAWASNITLPQVERYVEAREGQLTLMQRYLVYGKLPDAAGINSGSIMAAALVSLSYWRATQQQIARPSNESTYNKIVQAIATDISMLRQPLQPAALEVYEKILRADKNREIALMATFFGDCLKDAPNSSLYTYLGRANFYIWMAYTVYDDFLDEEGEPKYLLVANMAVREALGLYSLIGRDNRRFMRLSSEVFIQMDEANAWEVEYCRFKVSENAIEIGVLPKYGRRTQLAARSFAHALGPLAFVTQRWPPTSREARCIKKGFEHYLIARQLDDDAHDWLDDIKTGQVSFVVAYILRRLRIQAGRYELEELLVRMKKHFWQYSAQQICDITLRHIRSARDAFHASGIVELDSQFASLLTKIERSAQQTRARQISEHEFMSAYKQLR